MEAIAATMALRRAMKLIVLTRLTHLEEHQRDELRRLVCNDGRRIQGERRLARADGDRASETSRRRRAPAVIS
jgi:hypothetical protein